MTAENTAGHNENSEIAITKPSISLQGLSPPSQGLSQRTLRMGSIS